MAVFAIVTPAADPGAKTQASAAKTAALKDARRLLQKGRYAEGGGAFAAVQAQAAKQPGGPSPPLRVGVGPGQTQVHAGPGEMVKAIAGLKTAAAEEPKNPDLPAQLAYLYLDRGDWEAAEAAMRQAEKRDPDHLQARWIEARLLELRGELDKAITAWKWFVDRYNAKKPQILHNPDALPL